MEDENDIEDVEIVASHRQREANEDGVKDDPELEDEDCSHLSCEMIIIKLVFSLMPEVILTTWRVAEVILSSWNTASSWLPGRTLARVLIGFLDEFITIIRVSNMNVRVGSYYERS